MPDGFSAGVTARLAEPADIDPIMAVLMGPDGLYQNSAAGLGVSADHDAVKGYVTAACNRNGGVAGVIDGVDEIAGTIGIFIWKPWYSAEWILCEYWLYVAPKYRGIAGFNGLQDFAESHRLEMSRLLGRNLPLQETIVTHDRLELKERLWSRRAKKIGAVFALGLGDRS